MADETSVGSAKMEQLISRFNQHRVQCPKCALWHNTGLTCDEGGKLLRDCYLLEDAYETADAD